jgi:hypothetical protein
MSKYLSTGLSIVVLIGVIVSAIGWVRAFYNSVENHHSLLYEADLPPQAATLPQSAKVVVVLIGGLGSDALQTLNLPAFEQFAQTGATAVIQSLPPSYSQIAQVTLVTGASPEVTGASLIDSPLEDVSLIEIDTIFARAHQSQQKTAILGPADWRRLISRNHLDETFFTNAAGPDADQAIVEAALPLLNSHNIDLIFIHLTQLDFAAKHQGGPSSSPYRLAAGKINEHLSQISRATDMSDGVLIILGDHGYTSSGGYGGAELEVIRQPFVMLGQKITPGNYSDIQHTDIAPTISTLLGTPPPTAAQGRILFEMLRLDEHNQTITQLVLAQQRVSLAKAYLAAINEPSVTLPDTLFADLAQAQTAFDQNNIAGAFQLASLTQEVADTHIAMLRSSHIQAEQWARLLTALPVAFIWLMVMWRRRGSHAGLIIVATIVTISLYHMLYQLQGNTYSISAVNNFAELPFDIARRTAVSYLAGGGLILVFLMLVDEENWINLLGTGYGFGVLVTFVFILPLFWAYWQNGFVIHWHLPDVDPVFWQITGLFEVMIAAILGLLLPWPIMLLNLLVNLARRYLDESPSRSEPDALPGLHL